MCGCRQRSFSQRDQCPPYTLPAICQPLIVVPAGDATPESSGRRVRCRAPCLLCMPTVLNWDRTRQPVRSGRATITYFPVPFCPLGRTLRHTHPPEAERKKPNPSHHRRCNCLIHPPLNRQTPTVRPQVRGDSRTVCYATAFKTLCCSRSRPRCSSQA